MSLQDLIEVWACPTCGYWRQLELTGVHAVYSRTGAAERHTLVRVEYRLVASNDPVDASLEKEAGHE